MGIVFKAAAIAAVTIMLAPTAAEAQMRVQRERPVDPRLRQPRIETPSTTLPPRVSPDDVETMGGPRQPAPRVTQAPVQNTVPMAAQDNMQAPALRTPSYLAPDPQTGPASGPSSIDLMKQCFAGTDGITITNAPCVGYMAGYLGAVRISSSISEGFPICLPESGVTNEAVVSQVSEYLEDNPDALDKSARSVVFFVLASAYPCT